MTQTHYYRFTNRDGSYELSALPKVGHDAAETDAYQPSGIMVNFANQTVSCPAHGWTRRTEVGYNGELAITHFEGYHTEEAI